MTRCDRTSYYYHSLRLSLPKSTERYLKHGRVFVIFHGAVDRYRRRIVENLMDQFDSIATLISDTTYLLHVPTPLSSRYDYKVVVSDEEFDDFHRYCRRSVRRAFEQPLNLILMDQSRIDFVDMTYYMYLAQKMHYVILTYPTFVENEEFATSGSDVEEEPNLVQHLLCGWFLHGTYTENLRRLASSYLEACFEGVEDFKAMLSKYLGKQDPKSYYKLDRPAEDMAFCVMKVVKDLEDFKSYSVKEAFERYYGYASFLDVVGFIISPQTISARVNLNFHQKPLWAMPDDVDEESEVTVFPSEILKDSKIDLPGEDIQFIPPGYSSFSSEYPIEDRGIYGNTLPIPYTIKSRSCHIPLGKADGASPKNVDYDVPFAVHKQRTILEAHGPHMEKHVLAKCEVTRAGDYWFVCPKMGQQFIAMFGTCCAPLNEENSIA